MTTLHEGEAKAEWELYERDLETILDEINQDTAAVVLEMNEETRSAWNLLSDFEKKTIVAFGQLTKRVYGQIKYEKFRRHLINENQFD